MYSFCHRRREPAAPRQPIGRPRPQRPVRATALAPVTRCHLAACEVVRQIAAPPLAGFPACSAPARGAFETANGSLASGSPPTGAAGERRGSRASVARTDRLKTEPSGEADPLGRGRLVRARLRMSARPRRPRPPPRRRKGGHTRRPGRWAGQPSRRYRPSHRPRGSPSWTRTGQLGPPHGRCKQPLCNEGWGLGRWSLQNVAAVQKLATEARHLHLNLPHVHSGHHDTSRRRECILIEVPTLPTHRCPLRVIAGVGPTLSAAVG